MGCARPIGWETDWAVAEAEKANAHNSAAAARADLGEDRCMGEGRGAVVRALPILGRNAHVSGFPVSRRISR